MRKANYDPKADEGERPLYDPDDNGAGRVISRSVGAEGRKLHFFRPFLYFFARIRDLRANPRRCYVQHAQIPSREAPLRNRFAIAFGEPLAAMLDNVLFLRSSVHVNATCREYLGCVKCEF